MAGDPNSVTVSGHQEGATFACSLQIILSDTIKGAGCIKGAAFAFDPDNLADGETADDIADEALDLIDTIEADIDPLENLQDRAVFILSADDDQ